MFSSLSVEGLVSQKELEAGMVCFIFLLEYKEMIVGTRRYPCLTKLVVVRVGVRLDLNLRRTS